MSYDFDKSIGKLSQQISRTLGRNLESKFIEIGIDLKASDWSIIAMLYKKGKTNQRDISKFLGYDKVMIKRRVDHLEKINLVVREESKEDKRFNNVKLTPKGESNYKSLANLAENEINLSTNNISEEDIENCIRVLCLIKENLISDIK